MTLVSYSEQVDQRCSDLTEAVTLTINLLDALQVILRQFEVLCVHVLVEGGHDGCGVV